MNVEAILKQCGWTEQHFTALGQAVPMGYKALQELVQTTPMLGQFIPGIKMVGYLRNLAVQHALASVAADSQLFYVDAALNKARNHAFSKIQAGNVVLTSHYAGADGTRGLRKTLSRGELATRNGDLFGHESKEPDAEALGGRAYVQMRHGGLSKPVFAALYIPTRDQQYFKLSPLILDLETPAQAKVEEVADRLRQAIKPKKKTDQQDRHAS